MRKRKVLAMVAGLVLSMSVAVPGTLAVEADSAGTESSSISVTSEDGTGAGTETGEGASTAAVTDFAAAAVAAVQTTASGSPESTSSEGGSGESTAPDANEKTGADAAEKTGTEASSEASEENETDATDKTAASAGTETGTETGAGTATGTETGAGTGTADGASKAAANASGASAANASGTFTHKDGCGDDCKDESCTCGCHLYRRIMACGTIDEIWEILDNADEASFSLLSEEQNAKIDARIEELEPEPAPAIVIEEATETVPSIIEYGLVSFTDVAPLGEPVTGGTD